jgi:negative regulator of flagellin synthesis FlgM
MKLSGDSAVTSKITGVDAKSVRAASGVTALRRPDQATDKLTTPGAGTDVQVTGTARSMAALTQSLLGMPAVDEARVAAVKRRLDSGEYRTDPQRIADRLLHLESDLARRSPVERSSLK